MNLLSRLYSEHDEHQVRLNSLEGILEEYTEGSKDEEFIKIFEEVCRELELHLKEEEEALFPTLKERMGEMAMPVFVMLREHEDMRQTCQRVFESHQRGEREKVKELCQYLIFLVRQHIEKENNILFNIAKELIREEELLELDGIAQRVRENA